MQKIASPQDLTAALQRILASTEGPERPSRAKIAAELRELASAVGSKVGAVDKRKFQDAMRRLQPVFRKIIGDFWDDPRYDEYAQAVLDLFYAAGREFDYHSYDNDRVKDVINQLMHDDPKIAAKKDDKDSKDDDKDSKDDDSKKPFPGAAPPFKKKTAMLSEAEKQEYDAITVMIPRLDGMESFLLNPTRSKSNPRLTSVAAKSISSARKALEALRRGIG
jgi:hypothetical protein